MEHFVVSARKYRPAVFEDVVGQEHITRTLKNAIENDQLAQAMLFCGPRGVGKTTCARILAREINKKTVDPEHADDDFAFNIYELDAASNNSVDDIRSLIEQVRYAPQVGKYKVYIIDEVHMLSQSAFNAFLKTLEEPPAHAVFILATTEKHKILPTILSRCQIFEFKRISVEDMENHLERIAADQGVQADPQALRLIAQKADGALRDALSIFDRLVGFCEGELSVKAVAENLNVIDGETYLSFTEKIKEGDIPSLLVDFDRILASGYDPQQFLVGLAAHFRDLIVSKDPSTVCLLEVGDALGQKYAQMSSSFDYNVLLQALDIVSRSEADFKSSKNQRLLVELTLMRLASLCLDPSKKKVLMV